MQRGGETIELTAREAELLEMLMRNPRTVVSRQTAVERIWGGAAVENVVDRYVARLRAQARRPAADPDRLGGRLHTRGVRRRSLNLRLTLAATAAVLLAVLILGVGARLIVSNQLHSSLDSSLRQRAVEVARLAVSAPAVLTAPGSARIADLRAAAERRGARPQSRRSSPARSPLAPSCCRAGPRSRRLCGAEAAMPTPSSTANRSASYAAPIAAVGGPAGGGVVLVAASTEDIEDTLHQLGLLLILCAAAAVLAGALAAALLTRRSTRPLRELSSSATSIERTGDASRRLAEPAESGGDRRPRPRP